MAANGNGTNQYLLGSGTINPLVANYSISFWYKPAGAPASGGATNIPMSIVAGAGAYDIEFEWSGNNASFYKGLTHANGGGGSTTVQIPSPPSGAWIHLGFTWDGSNMRGYLNGVLFATTAGSNPPGGAGSPRVSVCCWDGTNAFDSNPIAELAVWNTTLTQANITSLFNGVNADSVGSGLVFYDHLNGGAVVVGPSLTNHSVVFNTTYFTGLTGGIALGSSAGMPNQTTYHFTMSGGIALGGANMQVASQAVFSSSITLSGSSGRAPVFVGTLALTGAFTQPECHAAFVGTLALQGKFRCNAGSIANGRSMAYTTQ